MWRKGAGRISHFPAFLSSFAFAQDDRKAGRGKTIEPLHTYLKVIYVFLLIIEINHIVDF